MPTMFGSSGSLTFPMAYNFDHESPGTGKGKWWSYYTRNEKCLCVTVTIVSALLIGLAIATTIIGVQFAALKNKAIELGISTNSSAPYPGWNQCLEPSCVIVSARLQESLNNSVDPCENFYEFACGGWIKNNPIPVSSGRWGQFGILRGEVKKQIKEILEEDSFDETINDTVSSFPEPLLAAQQFYDVCISQVTNHSISLTGFLNYMDEVLQINNLSSDITALGPILGIIRREISGNYLFELYVAQDERNTTNFVIHLDRPEFGIDRENLLDKSNEGINYRDAYRDLIRQVWTVMYPQDTQEADTIATDILQFEISLANISMSPEQQQNKSLMYNPMTLTQLYNLTSNVARPDREIKWKQYLEQVFKILLYNNEFFDPNMNNFSGNGNVTGAGAGVNGTIPSSNVELVHENRTQYYTFADYDNDAATEYHLNQTLHLDFSNMTFIVHDIAYFQNLDNMINKARLVTVVDYLKWRILRSLAPEVNRRFRELFFQFEQRTNGVILPPAMWSECVDRANFYFPMAISYRYVEKYFDKETLHKAKTLVADVMSMFEDILAEVKWLDAETRREALNKALKMKVNVGYPEWLKNFTALDEYYKWLDLSSPGNHFYNMVDLAKWSSRKNLVPILTQKQEDWIEDPIVVNALYSATYNSINFPAAILQPPFYGMPLEALNYGAMGAVVGHEITHGFDDRGSQNDADGNLHNWWNENTLANYMNKTQCFVRQYSSYHIPEINMTINGQFTRSENIADNGGLRQAYKAFKRFERNNPQRQKLLPGFTNYNSDQLFFLSYAHIMCETGTLANLAQQIQTDVHTPSKYRVNGVMANSVEFAQAWDCPLPSVETRCQVW